MSDAVTLSIVVEEDADAGDIRLLATLTFSGSEDVVQIATVHPMLYGDPTAEDPLESAIDAFTKDMRARTRRVFVGHMGMEAEDFEAAAH